MSASGGYPWRWLSALPGYVFPQYFGVYVKSDRSSGRITNLFQQAMTHTVERRAGGKCGPSPVTPQRADKWIGPRTYTAPLDGFTTNV